MLSIQKPQSVILVSDLFDYICALDTANSLTDEVKSNMANSYAVFLEQATTKFIAGQKEHGGDIRDRDLTKEMSAELIDLFFYGPFGAASWPTKT